MGRRDRIHDSSSPSSRAIRINDNCSHPAPYSTGNSCSRHPSRGSITDSASIASGISSESFFIQSSWLGRRFRQLFATVICVLAIVALLTIVSFSRRNQSLHSSSSLSSGSTSGSGVRWSESHADSISDHGSWITISAAAAAAFSSGRRIEDRQQEEYGEEEEVRREDANEINPISPDPETVVVESRCSKFTGFVDDGSSFSFRVSLWILFFLPSVYEKKTSRINWQARIRIQRQARVWNRRCCRFRKRFEDEC